tara:strand:+ start:2554 stop:3489 length:936 start_codon:yes stop_codon:yes gene_type:complete
MQRTANPCTPVRFRPQPPLVAKEHTQNKENMKVGIIGYGFVGKALHNGLNPDNKVLLIDPKLKTSVSDLRNFCADILFVCAPSPMNNNGTQDLSILNEIFEELFFSKIDSLIILKSTILPDALLNLSSKFPNLVFNPEFLREKHADEDFIGSNLIVFGGNREYVNKASNFYKNHTKCTCKEHIKTDLVTASLIKYTINSFLATKVTFFNEINNIFITSNAEDSWENFIGFLSKDKRIGRSHMSVPGHDGKLGFGGACLPKDSRALLEFSKIHGQQFDLLNEVIKVNNSIRGQYNVGKRESDQNIDFLDKKE